MFANRGSFRIVVGCLLATAWLPVAAADWQWPVRFTENSAPELIEIYGELYASGARLEPGVRVDDVHFESEAFDLHMKSGVLYPEPSVDGYPAGAYFVGDGTVTFEPDDPRARGQMQFYLGAPALDAVPIDRAYIFTLLGAPLAEILGVEGEGREPLEDHSLYGADKRAFRQYGLAPAHALLDRAHRGNGSVYVLFSPESIRTKNSPEARLLYSLEPTSYPEIGLSVFGHENILDRYRRGANIPWLDEVVYFFWPIVGLYSEDELWTRQADVAVYEVEIDATHGTKSAAHRATLEMTPEKPIRTFLFSFGNRCAVESVTLGPEGPALPFLQWTWDPDRFPVESSVLVQLPTPLEVGKPVRIVVNSRGKLFDPGYEENYLAEEDLWYPQVGDRDGGIFDLRITVPKDHKAVAPGQLLGNDVVAGNRVFHYRTTKPHTSATFAAGSFDTRKGKADDLDVEVYLSHSLEGGEVKLAQAEVENALRIFARILQSPLEVEQVRVAGIPAGHGRGFEGMILMNTFGATGVGAGSDFFRAHEVAHQWWGNRVRTKNWPEDRWLSESLAEYCAMEYHKIRYEKPGRTRDAMRDQWYEPVVRKGQDAPMRTLTGEVSRENPEAMQPLIEGGSNVYNKGPLVLHQLRYVFVVKHKSDELFWTLLQDFLAKYDYQEASSRDFFDMAEKAMGGKLDWFWNQWFYGGGIPTVRYETDVRQQDGKWILSVRGEQVDTEFWLAIPVHLKLADGRDATVPLTFQGTRTASFEIPLPSKPSSVSLNDDYEAPVRLDKGL